MKNEKRSASCIILVALFLSSACDQDCDDLCIEDHDDCVDEQESDRCDAELTQCLGTCGGEPQDFGPER